MLNLFQLAYARFLGFPLKLVSVANLDMDYHVQMHVIEISMTVKLP